MARTTTRQRRAALLDAVQGGDGNIQQLADRFEVSASTIRRDLAELARDGHVVRTYGGALDSAHGLERSLREKDASNAAEKDAIARAAAAEIADGEIVLLDAGTTTGRVARHLTHRRGLTVVTNGLPVILAVADNPEIELIVLGGRLRHPNEAIVGTSVHEQLRNIAPDRVFLGADGLDPVRGLCCPTLEQAQLKQAMAGLGRERYVLADHSKFGLSPFSYWAALDGTGTIITDAAADEVALREFAGRDNAVVRAGAG